MKKLIALLLVLTMAFALVACGEDEETTPTKATESATEPSTEPATEPATEDATQPAVEVMSYADFLAAETDDKVCVESFVQAHQSWWYDDEAGHAAHLLGQNSYDQEEYTGPTAFLIGNEGNGLTDELSALSDCYIRIPMCGKVESLNAAIASAILMYEAGRQRRQR